MGSYIQNHIFYYADSNYGSLIYMEWESEEKNSNVKYLATGVAIGNLKKLNKGENSSCSKVPDVGIQNYRIWTTITAQKTNKGFEVAGPRNILKP